jgi:hypothetical protein
MYLILSYPPAPQRKALYWCWAFEYYVPHALLCTLHNSFNPHHYMVDTITMQTYMNDY